MSRPGKDPVKRPEKPSQKPLHETSKPIFWRLVILEQNCAKCRRKRQRVESRNDCRDGNRNGELLVKLAGQSADEGSWNEYRAQHQGRGNNRAGNFAHGTPRRFVWRQT